MFGDRHYRVGGLRVALGGDKGYRLVKTGDGAQHETIGDAMLLLTKSASDAAEDDADQADDTAVRAALDRPGVRIEARFAVYRGVIERVIGKMKSMSKFLAGPITLRQQSRLFRVLVIVSALVNRQVKLDSSLFAKARIEESSSSSSTSSNQ
jgi:hypothetical protein